MAADELLPHRLEPSLARSAAGAQGLVGVVACTVLALGCLAVTARLVGSAATPFNGVELAYLVSTAVMGLVSLTVGVVVGVRRPSSVVALLLGLQGLVPCLLGVSDAWTAVVTDPAAVVGPTPWPVALAQASWMLWFVPPALLLVVFPSGTVLSRRWRGVVVALIAVPVLYLASLVFSPVPSGAPFDGVPAPLPAPAGLADVVTAVGMAAPFSLLGLLIVALVSAVLRYRRSRGVERAQLTWFLLGAACVPLTLLLCWLSYLLLDGPDLVVLGLFAIGIAIPVSTGIAMLRHDLYDVDRALAATTTYALLSVGLLAVYTAASFVGGLSLGSSSPVAAAAATAVCAAALAPVRRHLRHAVDRRLHPVRQRVLTAVADLQRRTHAGLVRPEQLERVLADAFAAPGMRVGYRLPGTAGLVDGDGTPLPPSLLPSSSAAAPHCVAPVVVSEEEVGALIAPPGVSRTLLREAASASALLVEVVRLRVGLSGALRDVADSRSRLLAASLQERRRLEQDLHDGAQQRLVSLGMSLRITQRRLASGTLDSTGGDLERVLDGVLDGAVQQLSTAVAELRQVAHGLRPSSLDDGLGPALGSLLERVPVPVDLQVDLVEEVPEPAATTAYYVASEAVTNAVKHAAAERISVAVARVDSLLHVRVSDDGCGGARLTPGTGLAGLADRVAAAGGAMRLSSTPGAGTLVEVELPCAS